MSNTTEVVTTEYAEAMNEAVNAANRAEAEATRLKRKYEPDDGVIMDMMLQLTNDHGRGYMRVLVRTDEYLLLELVPTARKVNATYDLSFKPHIEGKKDNMQDFDSYGVYTVYIGDGTFGHHCIVNFDESGVHITPIHEPDVEGNGPLEIENITETCRVATVSLTPT
eukprot:COSAG02_NODE_828_length_16703_cov_298.705312_2_plen_167_part_00